MERYTVNIKEPLRIIHSSGNYHRRVQYNEKDFDVLVVKVQDDRGIRYFAISAEKIADNVSASVYFDYDPDTGKLQWSSVSPDDVVDVTALYPKKEFRKPSTLNKYPEFERAGKPTFEEAWEELTRQQPKWKPLPNRRGSNTIVDINNNGITRISSSNKRSKIPIESFYLVYEALRDKGSLTEPQIMSLLEENRLNKRCSACIVSVFGQLDYIDKIDTTPIRLQLK